MKSKRSILIISAIAIIFYFVPIFTLQSAHSHEKPLDAAETIRSRFPTLRIDRIETTEIDGLYELTLKDDILYYHPDSGTTFFGELWSKEKKNLTAIRKAALQTAKINDLPFDKAIKIGNGPHTVIEIVDPDCPYCRKTHAFFNKRKDLTRYVFLYPITQIHPEAEIKSLYILCSENRQEAYEEALSGGLDDLPLTPCTDEAVTALLDQHKQVGKQLNVRGTPALWIDGQFVSGADFKKITEILDGH